ncbi:hypothetical protein CARUB_v10028637mg [Capsella rubella]|uniref:MI domain-containing protein n=2 Tax=Capsella rubella TaxID=81985 RepID=R0GSB9_9BRAS|nr:hypothetical protein CARUB_v10028637mg [Capsella rubella]
METEHVGLRVRVSDDEDRKISRRDLETSGGDKINSHEELARRDDIAFKQGRMMNDVKDKSSIEYQRLTWDALRKSIDSLVNKVDASNIKNIIPELFAEDLIRGRGLFCRCCIKSQMASPGLTNVYAALVAVVNSKFPQVSFLLLKRVVLQLKRAYKRNDRPQLLASVKFIAHLVNQQVSDGIIALELLTLLLEDPTDDKVEVSVGFVTECGAMLQYLTPEGMHGIFERFRGILYERVIDKRVQYLIERLFAIRKAKFQGRHQVFLPELYLVEEQISHDVSLDQEIDPETGLDVFHFIDKEEDDEEMRIRDETETNLVNLRRKIYLSIMYNNGFEEAGNIKLEPGQEIELCTVLLECCFKEKTYLPYYGLLGQRLCMSNKIHQDNFEKCFVQNYSMSHLLETNKLHNVATFFAHLLSTNALSWHVLAYIRLTEENTTPSSRIFVKIIFQKLSDDLGIEELNERLQDPLLQELLESSIFLKDSPKNTSFAISFFTSIGLGGITESLREYLREQKQAAESE